MVAVASSPTHSAKSWSGKHNAKQKVEDMAAVVTAAVAMVVAGAGRDQGGGPGQGAGRGHVVTVKGAEVAKAAAVKKERVVVAVATTGGDNRMRPCWVRARSCRWTTFS